MCADNLSLNFVNRSESRIEYIDSIKGFAILLMIFGHLQFHNLNWFIYSFHMPLFFVISGYFFNAQKSIKRRIKRLLFPYCYTAIGIICLEALLCLQGVVVPGEFNDITYKLKIVVASVLCGCGNIVEIFNYSIPPVGPIWFLVALSIGFLVLWIVMNLQNRYNIRSLSVLGCFILALTGWGISLVSGQIPLSINQALVVPVFLLSGGLIRRLISSNNYNYILVLASLLLWGLLLFFQKNIEYMSMTQMRGFYYPLYLIGSISASFLVIVLFKYLSGIFKFTYLKMLGRLTLIVLCLHSIDIIVIEPRVYAYTQIDGSINGLIMFCAYKVILYSFVLLFLVYKEKNKDTLNLIN